jgi:hypothetical protein
MPVVPVNPANRLNARFFYSTTIVAEWDGFLLIEKGRTNSTSSIRGKVRKGHSLQIRTFLHYSLASTSISPHLIHPV